uniref:Nucleolar protein 11 n=1 Tax=Oryzias sinensis TaxID=183150 RepID=A0A8C7Z5V4_9TELE
MAALYEGYTLCGLTPDQNNSSSGIDGIEEERDSDHVIVTDSNRTVTLYKVSDQKPLGSWTVKQGQTLTCSAVFNSQANEYVAVSDNKVIRIWKEGDVLLDKTFKATVKADIWKVHCAGGEQPIVLFRRGAVRQLEHLLSDPQQPIEDVLAEEEAVRLCLLSMFERKLCFCTLILILSSLFLCRDQLVKRRHPFPSPLTEEVQKEVAELLSRQDIQDLQLGKLASVLVCRSQADPHFYAHSSFVQLVHSQSLCHSVCPDLLPLALERKDYFLCQMCLLGFPDIPEVLTCTCLKAFICLPDVDAEKMCLEPDSVSFMETLITSQHCQGDLQNGFSPPSRVEEAHSDTANDQQTREGSEKATSRLVCPVGSHKAALLNGILQAAYSDTFLLPHLKDLNSQHVLLFLRYLQFLYLRYSQDTFPQAHSERAPSLHQILDWICMMLDAHFTVLVMTPEAKGFLLNLHGFVQSQVKLFSELGKIEGSLQELQKMKRKQDVGQYSIEIIEIF